MILAAIISRSTNLQQLQITCVADVSGSLSGKYFLMRAPDGSKYYVWIDVDNGSSDPNLSGYTGIEVDISANDTANTVAAAVDTAIEAINEGDDEFVSSVSSAVVTVNYVAEYEEIDSGFSFALVGEADPSAGGGFIYLICTGASISGKQGNKVIKSAAHVVIRVNIGKYSINMGLSDWILFNTDGTSLSAENFNDVLEFIVGHWKSSGYDLYLHLFNLSLGGYRVKFPDANSTMQNYRKISISSFDFDIDNSGVWRGEIQLEEG